MPNDRVDSNQNEYPGWVPGGSSFQNLITWVLRQARGEGRDPDALARLEEESRRADDAN